MEAAHRRDAGAFGVGPRQDGSGCGEASPPFLVGERVDATGRATVTLQGELDLATKATAEEAVRRAQRLTDVVVLDLRGVSFMDSAGVHVVIDADVRQRGTGRRLVVLTGSPQVLRILMLTGVAEQLEIADDITAAEATQEMSDAG
jgi:anti-sigma B factor antagonist